MRTMRRAAALKALWAAVAGQRRAGAPPLRTQVAAVPRMIAMSVTGRYPGLDRSRLGMMLLGALYVVSPVDLVPEAALLLVGLADDAMVLAWLAGTLLSETDAFLEWERGAGRGGASGRPSSDHVVPGEVVT